MNLPAQNPKIMPTERALIKPYDMNSMLLGRGVNAKMKVPAKYPKRVLCKYFCNLSRLDLLFSFNFFRPMELYFISSSRPPVAAVAPIEESKKGSRELSLSVCADAITIQVGGVSMGAALSPNIINKTQTYGWSCSSSPRTSTDHCQLSEQ